MTLLQRDQRLHMSIHMLNMLHIPAKYFLRASEHNREDN